ncbi:lipopolysaccharide biosynthesis protein [Chitiniphilus shinanonensis]|uniref:lipopolysaccharide biosynthesis protein n=1 Tax=Chitiniphilus shinanonensis TaxID=553088 RepID=UPI0030419CBE
MASLDLARPDGFAAGAVIRRVWRSGALGGFVLRGAGLVSKFVLMVYLARVLPPAELGFYGLFTAAVAYAVFAVGLDFYTYANRDLIGRPEHEWPARLRDQGLLHGAGYLVLGLGAGLVGAWREIPATLVLLFCAILVCEHLAIEVYRLLVIQRRNVRANVVFFCRIGLPAYVAIAVMLLHPPARSVSTVLGCWLVGSALGVALGAAPLARLPWRSLRGVPVDMARLLGGLRIAAVFLAGTLLMRVPLIADRYLLDFFADRATVGVYTFFFGIAAAIPQLLEASVVAQRYPRLVEAHKAGRLDELARLRRGMLREVGLVTLSLSIACLVLIHPLLLYIGRVEYEAHWPVLLLLVLANGLSVVSLAWHYHLYAGGRDRAIFAANALSVAAFLIAALLLTPRWGIVGMGVALSVAALAQAWYRWAASRKLTGAAA